MRIVFLGTPRAALPALESLLAAGHQLPLVISQPDRPSGRSRRPLPTPVKEAALAAGLEVRQPAKVRNAAFRELVDAVRPDLLVVVAYGRILPAKVLALAPHGAINLHFSLLPKYRGAAPVQWALASGETITGISTMQLSEGLDEGDLLLQKEVPIDSGEHAPALTERLAAIGAGMLVETVSLIGSGKARPRPQQHAEASLAPILTKRDGEIDLTLEARLVEGRVRGFDPWPGVWIRRGKKRLRILRARALEGPPESLAPGTVAGKTPEGVVLACGAGSRLLLQRVQPAGRKAISALDALNGRQLAIGESFERKIAES